jgi:hypothetical protein
VNIFSTLVKTGLGLAVGGPAGAVVAAGAASQENRAKNQAERAAKQQREAIAMMRNIPDPQYFGSTPPNVASNQPVGFFEGLGTGLGALGTGIGDFFQAASPLTSLFGIDSGFQRTNAGTALTINNQRPQETAQSGEILGANLGLAPALFQGARSFLRSPGGQSALGFAAGAAGALLAPDGQTAPRITRKMKSDVRRIYMMAGMNPDVTAQILNNMGTYPRMNFNSSLVFFILTKRFRNDGPVVTKAAVRKTKTTLRRMKGVVDMYNSVCKPTAPRRRAAPSRAKAVQLISNK